MLRLIVYSVHLLKLTNKFKDVSCLMHGLYCLLLVTMMYKYQYTNRPRLANILHF